MRVITFILCALLSLTAQAQVFNMNPKIPPATVYTNNLRADSIGTALDATQGKILKALIDAQAALLAAKQAALVAGGNIKTIGGVSILGSGDLPIPAPSNAVIWAMFGGGNGISYAGNGTFHIDNAAIAILVNSTLRGFSGFDESVANQVLSHTGSTFKWIVATTTGGSSSTTTTPSPSATAYRDSVLINADSTKMRFIAANATTVNISTVAQLRNVLTTTQTDKRFVVANGTYNDGNPFVQSGAWTNVSIEAANSRQAILENNNSDNVWLDQDGTIRRRVRIRGLVFRTSSTNNGLGIVHHNELPDYDGQEWDDNEIYHTNPTAGKCNGITYALYSEGSKQGKVMKNLFFHNNYVHDIPRANEILSHGFDIDRLYNVIVTNNRFENTGMSDTYGVPLSYSGRIKYGYTAKNKIKRFRRMAIEHVANRFMLTEKNEINSTETDGGVGIAISDNNLNLTERIWVENNTVNVMDRPFYAYGVKYLTMTGGSYIGRNGADGSPINSVFKDFNLTVWSRPGMANYVWNFDGSSGGASGNTVSNITASSGGTQANSLGGPTAYTIHLTSGSANNTFTDVTTILGKDANGSWGGSGAIINDGANTNVITNNTVSRVN